MRILFDDRKDWYEYRKKVYLEILKNNDIDFNIRRFVQQNKNQVIYETPKTFVDGVAYNDGTWVIYNTIKCNKRKKAVWNIKITNYEHLIRVLYGYIAFLKVAGINDKESMLYFTLTFFDRLTFLKGIFDCNDTNKKRILQLVEFVIKKNIDELTKDWTRNETKRIRCWDDRKFAIKTDGMSTSEIRKIQHKVMGKKQKTDELIKKHYKPNLSIAKNLEILKENGVKCSKRRLCNWMKEQKEQTVQNDPVSIINDKQDNGVMAVQNDPVTSDREMPEDEIQAVQNEPVKNDDRLCKMNHNYLNKLNRNCFDWHQNSQEEKRLIHETQKQKEKQLEEKKIKGIYDVIITEDTTTGTTGNLSYEIDNVLDLFN